MKRFKAGKYIITFVGLFTMFAAYVADWNVTHIYNPNWTPHAKFHNAQTMAFATLLGGLSLYFLWVRRGDQTSLLKLAVLFGSLYWIAQAAAFIFPGVASFDVEFAASAPSPILGLPGQLATDIIAVILLGIGYLLERVRVVNLSGETNATTHSPLVL